MKVWFYNNYQLIGTPSTVRNVTETYFAIDNKEFESVLVFSGLKHNFIEWYSVTDGLYYYSSMEMLDDILSNRVNIIWKEINDDECGKLTIKAKLTFVQKDDKIVLSLVK